jgi:hypothetical protein
MNIQSNCTKMLGENLDEFVEQWMNISSQATTVDEFVAAKAQLAKDFPSVADYMTNIWTVEAQFAFCHTKAITTFGMRSTQRVEGKNAKLKVAMGIDSTAELVTTFTKLLTCVTEEQQRKIDTDRKQIRQQSSHSLSSWTWKLKEICTPMAIAWIRKEGDVAENYTVSGPNPLQQFIVEPANHVRKEYQALLASFTNEQRQRMLVAAVTQDIALAELNDEGEQNDSDSSSSTSESNELDRALKRAAMLHSIMHQPPYIVGNIREPAVTCTCGAVTRMLLPCRHVIAVNRTVFKYAFVEEQVVNRWRREFMINPLTKQPEKPKLQVWQPHELQGQMRIHTSTNERENASVEEKVDGLLDRARAIAVKSMAMFSQLSTIVKPWIQDVLKANPQWTDLVSDPPVKYGRNTSKKRIRSNGEDENSARNTRRATQQEVELMVSQQSDSGISSFDVNPSQGFDVGSDARDIEPTQLEVVDNEPHKVAELMHVDRVIELFTE